VVAELQPFSKHLIVLRIRASREEERHAGPTSINRTRIQNPTNTVKF